MPAPHELLDDGYAPEPCELLVIGCGNILRGDDAVGPVLVRTLFTRGVPDGVRLVDGGTSGMDVAFGMRGAARVVIVDASSTGAKPGTIYRVPAEELAELPPLTGLHTHNFRWDHALALSSWLLGPLRPSDITVFLVEAASYEPGAALTPAVEAAMTHVAELLEGDFYPAPAPVDDVGAQVEITAEGYLRLPAALAERYFPADVLVARREQNTLMLLPIASVANGGLVLKRRNAAGDRSVLLNEVLGFDSTAGVFAVHWDDEHAALSVSLTPAAPPGDADGDRGGDGGGGRARSVVGVPRGPDRPGDRPAAPVDPSDRAARQTGGGRGAADGGPAPRTTGGPR